MTTPEEREAAKTEVAEALARAENVRDRGARIAEGWKRSRTDNNFRMMLRALGQKAEPHA